MFDETYPSLATCAGRCEMVLSEGGGSASVTAAMPSAAAAVSITRSVMLVNPCREFTLASRFSIRNRSCVPARPVVNPIELEFWPVA